MIQLSNSEINCIKAILVKHVPNYEAWFFGSRAKGKANKYSDLDLLLKGFHAVPLHTLGLLTEEFENSGLLFKVELTDWHRITPEFQNHIQTHWQCLIN